MAFRIRRAVLWPVRQKREVVQRGRPGGHGGCGGQSPLRCLGAVDAHIGVVSGVCFFVPQCVWMILYFSLGEMYCNAASPFLLYDRES